MQRNLIIAGFVVLGAVVLWQEVRLRSVERRAPSVEAAVAPRLNGAPATERRFARAPDSPPPEVDERGAAIPGLASRAPLAQPAHKMLGLAAQPAAAQPAAPVAEASAAPGEQKEVIADIVAAEIAKREEARSEQRRARWLERTQEALAEFAEEHELSEDTSESMLSLVTAEREQMFDLFRRARAGEVPFSEAMDKVRTLRGETDENAKALLDEDQFVAYQARREEERGPWTGRGRGR